MPAQHRVSTVAWQTPYQDRHDRPAGGAAMIASNKQTSAAAAGTTDLPYICANGQRSLLLMHTQTHCLYGVCAEQGTQYSTA